MKRKYVFIVIIGLFVVTAGFLAIKQKKEKGVKEEVASFYSLKGRRGAAQSAEVKKQQSEFDGLMKIVRTNPVDTKSRIALAALYINEARITGDYHYYNEAALKYVNEVLAIDSTHFEALTYKALLHLSDHHFREGLLIAEKARALTPENAFVHGILVDANVELGNYTAAIEEADKMISIRPDLRSYSRISYLREIHGDYPGAIEAMKLAVDAGYPGDEATEWARVHLGYLYETIGDLKTAEMHYLIALERRSGYAYALAGQGRIALAKKEYDKAITFYLQADSVIYDQAVKGELADAYRLSGQKIKSDSILQSLVTTLNHDDEHGHHHDNEGHNADMELAWLYMKTGEYSEALEHALDEYKRRPANIEANETVAWAYYMQEEYKKALPYIGAAMKTKSQKPDLLCRAGLINAKVNNVAVAKSFLHKSLNNTFSLDEDLKGEAEKALQSL